MSQIANDLPVFDRDILDFQSAYQSLVKNFDELVEQMNSLNEMWEGEAHNQFMETFSKDQAKIQELIDFFEKILKELRFAHSEYMNCENSVAGIIDSINV